jgi:hypothetical protein
VTDDQRRRRFETVRKGIVDSLYGHRERWRDDEVNLWVAHLPLPKVRLTPDEYDAAFLQALQETVRRMTREVDRRERGHGRR